MMDLHSDAYCDQQQRLLKVAAGRQQRPIQGLCVVCR